jgi:DNA modification methylase
MIDIIHSDCLDAMRRMEDNSIDFVVTDPPYGLCFMGKDWDGAIPGQDIWAEALRICKPGSMLAAFGGSRTHHHLMLALEQAGWEIRDVIMWLYGSGFPKSRRVSMFLDQYLQKSDVCQCDENMPCNGYTFPLQNVFDHICNLDIWQQAVNVTQNDLYDLKKVLGFPDGYQFDHHSYDEFLRLSSILYLKLFPSQQYAQEHNHYVLNDDVEAIESLHNLFQVRYNDLLSKQDLILSAFYQHVFSLLQECKAAHESLDDSHKKLNKQQDFLISFHKLVEHKNPLNILDIFCLVFCLPLTLVKLLVDRKIETILPLFNVCGQCNKLIDRWKSFGTALKPAYEPIIICMKPLDGTFAQNAEKWGVAGINVESSRIVSLTGQMKKEGPNTQEENAKQGRWPSNLLLDESSAAELDTMTGIHKGSKPAKRKKEWTGYNQGLKKLECEIGYNDTGYVSRYFYCAKTSSSERNRGLEGLPDKIGGGRCSTVSGDTRTGDITIQKNNHPTVKPIALMKYILKLLAPPGNPICLDPFAGSGSTLVAAKELGISCIGIEKEEEYVNIAKARIEAARMIPEQLKIAI